MEKRIFLAIVISFALLWAWAAIAPKLFPELAKKPAPAKSVATTTTTTDTTSTTTTTTTTTSAPAPTVAPPVAATPVSAERVQLTTIEARDYTAVLSNRGAQLVSFKLKNYKQKRSEELVDLVKGRDPQRTDYPFTIVARDKAVADRLNGALYSVNERTERTGARVVEYRYSDGRVTATKVFRFSPQPYLFDFSISVTPPIPFRVAVGPGIRTLGNIRSEASWLAALSRDTALTVPTPVANRDGGLVTSVSAAGVPEPRHCQEHRPQPVPGVPDAGEGVGLGAHQEVVDVVVVVLPLPLPPGMIEVPGDHPPFPGAAGVAVEVEVVLDVVPDAHQVRGGEVVDVLLDVEVGMHDFAAALRDRYGGLVDRVMPYAITGDLESPELTARWTAVAAAAVSERLMGPIGGWNLSLCDALLAQGGPMGLLPANEAGYQAASTLPHVGNLKGHLLLVHSGLDENVHPQHTMQLLTALTNAGKDAELRFFPLGAHGAAYNQASYVTMLKVYVNTFCEQVKPNCEPVNLNEGKQPVF